MLIFFKKGEKVKQVQSYNSAVIKQLRIKGFRVCTRGEFKKHFNSAAKAKLNQLKVKSKEPDEQPIKIDYSVLKKSELINLCAENGLDTLGTKSTLISRLELMMDK